VRRTILRLARSGIVVAVVLGAAQPGATPRLSADAGRHATASPAPAAPRLAADPAALFPLVDSVDRLAGIDTTHAPLAEIDRELSELDRHMARVSAQVEQAGDVLAVADVDRQRLAGAIAATEEQIDRLRRQATEQALAAYVAPRSDALAVFVAADDLDSSVRRSGLVRTVIGAEQQAAARLQAARADLLALQASLEQVEHDGAMLRRVVAGGQAQLEAAGTTRANVAAGLAARVQALEAEVLGQQQGQVQLVRVLSRAELAAEEAADTTMSMPIDAVITSEFGPRWGREHRGVDFESAIGVPIHAARAGVVIEAGWLDGYGQVTVIDHGGGVTTLYAHQSVQHVGPGQAVERGESIGAVGVTGNSTGPHLHFEVHVNGAAVDPRGYLP
jgi:murein DD-endopeptidase MepM/ murein hydrolase activator NlpD